MKSQVVVDGPLFMRGGGEMGALTRALDWSKTAVGDPEGWPQSLRTTLGIILNSRFPMFLWWGPELTCFYNDAYRPSLGKEGKHPAILGQPAQVAWAEIWPIIKPLIDQVLSGGGATWSEDQLIPIYRNGSLEDVYWTFSYSPVNDEVGQPAGVLVTCFESTDKIKVLKEVQEREDQLNFILDAAELSTWDLDLKTRDIIHSARLAEIFGHNKKTVLTHPQLRSQIYPGDVAMVEAAFEAAMSSGVYYYEARIMRPDKVIRWVKTKGRVVYDETGKPAKLLGTLQDVTEDMQHKQELLEREEKFRLLADSMPQFVWTGDAQGNLNYYNKSVYDYSGLSAQQLKKDGWLQIVHPDDREANIKKWMESVSTGGDFQFEHRFRRHDGVYRWQLSRATAQRDAAGKVQMWVGTSADIDEQKSASLNLETQLRSHKKELEKSGEELVKKDELYQLMISEVQDYAILFMSREGIVRNWNKGAEKIKGYTAEEIIGRSFSTFYTEEDRNRRLPDRFLGEALSTGRAAQEGWRVKKDGSRFWAGVVITALHDEDNNIVGFSKVTRDLTEKREAEERIKAHAAQLEEKNRELEKMNTELKSFAYVSSHDLQEPLRKIQTFATLVNEREAPGLTDKGRDYFRRMKDAANRMQTLIEDLLAYSRANSSERIFVKTDLHELAAEVLYDFKETIAAKDAVIEIGEMCDIKVIKFQFRQLLHNLIGNSLKFTREGVKPHVTIGSGIVKGSELNSSAPDPGKEYCHIRVADNGIGFEPEYKERIFEVFQRLHGKEEYKGTGIGLAIVKRIVDNHNGNISAHGKPGEGTTIDIYIPTT